jgi:vitamin B12 transporter
MRCRHVVVGPLPVSPGGGKRALSFRVPAAAAGATVGLLACALAAAAIAPAPLAAQLPGELRGVVLDRATASPVEGAVVRLVETGRAALTDAAGRFVLRGLESGTWTLRVERLGHASYSAPVTVRNGEVTRVAVRLDAAAVRLDAVRADAKRLATEGVRLDGDAIARSGAATAGDALRAVAGVVVRETSPGGPQYASIRGGAPDAVLVLVDGVPLNDPVTGSADLSAIRAALIESVTVLPGAQSARYGPRAGTGVILIQTRRAAADRSLALGAGSLGARQAAVAWGGSLPAAWSAGASWREQAGRFAFELPPEVGGGRRVRSNGDARSLDLFAAGSLRAATGDRLDVRLGRETLDRGLPGLGYAPSAAARQSLDRDRAALSWTRRTGAGVLSAAATGVRQTLHAHDAAPPFGLPYDDTTRIDLAEARAGYEHGAATAPLAWGAGFETRILRIRASALDRNAPATTLDAGAFGHASLRRQLAGARASLAMQLRADRDARDGGWVLNRSITATLAGARAAVHVANRSSWSPPALGDQFFRASVGVAPNPDLRAERVPSELEVGARARLDLGPVEATAHAVAYHGDIEGMIVWAPDFRFVWSPRNTDVRRRGVESGLAIASHDGRARVTAQHAWTHVTYDRAARDDVQVAYRPRATATLAGAVDAGAARLDAEARFTGVRNTAASNANPLPAFWTYAAGASRDWRLGAWRLATSVRIDRVFDERATLIFGFPEPGRVVHLRLRLTPGSNLDPIPQGAH